MTNFSFLTSHLGWQSFFHQQLSISEFEHGLIGRVAEHHRSIYRVTSCQGIFDSPIQTSTPIATVGDWVILDEQYRIARVLERSTLFKRKGAGDEPVEQLLAANVDTAFIVCAMNDDFSINRIERYLTIVNEAGAMAMVILTRGDMVEDTSPYVDALLKLRPCPMFEVIDARSEESCNVLTPMCKSGQTIVMLGSSGVGKSTLTNTLLGQTLQSTKAIRAQDSKGRHTTTSRNLLSLPTGGVVIDTPGMRELQLTNSETGLSKTFSDVAQFAQACRFVDCQHESEPGCAVLQAIEGGELELRRLLHYKKLAAEQARNHQALHEKRHTEKQFGKLVKRTMQQKKAFQQR